MATEVLLSHAAEAVRQLAPSHLRDREGGAAIAVRHTSSTEFCWYLTPTQHVVEFLLFNAVALPALVLLCLRRRQRRRRRPRYPAVVCDADSKTTADHSAMDKTSEVSGERDNGPSNALRKRRGQRQPDGNGNAADDADADAAIAARLENDDTFEEDELLYDDGIQNASCAPRAWSAMDKAIFVLTLLTMTSTVVYKALTDRLVYLLQPCHLSNLLLLFVTIELVGVLRCASSASGALSESSTSPRRKSTVQVHRRPTEPWFAFVFDTWYGCMAALLMPGASLYYFSFRSIRLSTLATTSRAGAPLLPLL